MGFPSRAASGISSRNSRKHCACRFPRPAYNITMPDVAPLSFEAGLQQLETIVKEMESGELPLERALELFERGMKLSETCRKQLEEAETRVEVLMRRAG